MPTSLIFNLPREDVSEIFQHIDDVDVRERLLAIHATTGGNEYVLSDMEMLCVLKALDSVPF